ncbi:MAG: tRNA (adenosine(37)-N6)-threonylcarbamoyltransferase complex ATPase subunit type 1 TsaE [Gammaproteobacteria bacterium]|nr:tRNA (adenosine(37)-N6)-threonylcarbamoyltransferase complex ATPase subunit type 1 TsaE [Gammaproteobacteria bacterium]
MRAALADEAATIEFAQRVWRALPEKLDGWILLLRGELGAGKSTFARALIRAAGHSGAVPSPTYTLVEPYAVTRTTIYHVDLYRIADEEELRYLGWNELDHGFRLVEWPDRAPGLSKAADLELTLSYEGDGRIAELSGLSARGKALLRTLSGTNSQL